MVVKSKRDKEHAEPTGTLRETVYEYGHVLNSGPGDSNSKADSVL